MRLWSIVPHNAGDKLANSVMDIAEEVTSFFDHFYTLNWPVKFVVSKVVFVLPEIDHRCSRVGTIVERDDLHQIVSMAMHDKMRVIVRGDGCRFFSFGYDLDSWLCAKHDDVVPTVSPKLIITDISSDLINTDWYDD